MTQIKSFKKVIITESNTFKLYEVLDEILNEETKDKIVRELEKREEDPNQLEINFSLN